MKNLYCTSTIFFFVCFPSMCAFSQIDLQCDGRDLHSIYFTNMSGFFRVDSVDTNPTNPIFVASNPMGSGGISINDNLDTLTGQETMYFINPGGNYLFWDGTNWINTFHTSGSSSAINPGGTSSYIFNLDGVGNSLYRYDGTGNGTLLLSNLGTLGGSVFDVATDNQGNFYLFYTTAQMITSYNSAGIPIDTFTTTGFPANINPGFALLGNRLYAVANVDTGLYEGIKTGNTINFTLIKNLTFPFIDIATCSGAGTPLAVFKKPDAPHFAVYPNPARDVTVIRLDNAAAIEIADCLGIQKKNINTRGLTEYTLTVSGWKAGVYFITALSENKTAVHAALIIQ